MAAEWKLVTLSGVADARYGYTASATLEPTGVKFLRVTDITSGYVDWTTVPYCTIDEASLAKQQLQHGDVVIARMGTIGVSALIDQTPPAAVAASYLIRFRPDPTRCNPQYLSYVLKSPLFWEFIASNGSSGSVQPNINAHVLGQFRMFLPPLAEQRAVAHILGTLDDKIALNRRQSATLEELARALFKAWFVDFEPVRAKLAGRPSASAPGELGELFPARLVPSELGEIPEGWGVGRLGDIVSRRGERIRARQATVLSAVTTGELVVSDEFFTKRVYSKSIERYLAVEEWDFAYNPSRANIGSMGMLKRPILGAVSPAYVVFRPQSAYRWYLDFLLRGNSVSRWVDLLASGSVRQSLSYSDLASIPVVVPPPSVPPAFDELWEILRKGIDAAEDESRTLADMRDVLLPRLVSGELRVGDLHAVSEGGEK